MNYQKIYDNLIEARKTLGFDRVDGYYEKHHIVPKSMGGSNEADNLVMLSAREHFVAHWMLWKIHRNRQMGFAFSCMAFVGNKNLKRDKITSYGYNAIKIARASAMSEQRKGTKLSSETKKKIGDGLRGKKRGNFHTPETKAKMSKSRKKYVGELHPLYGKPKSEEWRKKLSDANKKYALTHINNMQGKNHTEETKALQREIALNRPKLTCPHCGKEASPSMAARWHFDNCKKFENVS